MTWMWLFLIIADHFSQKIQLVWDSESRVDITPYIIRNQTTGYHGQI